MLSSTPTNWASPAARPDAARIGPTKGEPVLREIACETSETGAASQSVRREIEREWQDRETNGTRVMLLDCSEVTLELIDRGKGGANVKSNPRVGLHVLAEVQFQRISAAARRVQATVALG